MLHLNQYHMMECGTFQENILRDDRNVVAPVSSSVFAGFAASTAPVSEAVFLCSAGSAAAAASKVICAHPTILYSLTLPSS
ncbi:hypothetical protein [Hymenobacter metallilatus]|uniref:Uncharacterized protein n=1 Tax=Hymenobacter metallilatus TaxID=2493666 RepID=A0A428JTA9_9BACT|nr:hypothetical protein [Hymenobacter metallilatus]RSK37274.1 hypothetical protein EI290_01055 [Hymenobacter metallilatus]